jgi:hypothetical protein
MQAGPQNLGQHRSGAMLRLLHLSAIILGVMAALLFSAQGRAGRLWGKRFNPSSSSYKTSPYKIYKNRVPNVPAVSQADLERMNPQVQAEVLLESAVAGAADTREIQNRLEGWRGKLKWDDQLGQLTSVALNSSQSDVRDAAVEVQLAAYGLSKRDSTVDALIRQASSSNQERAAWALWSLGLLANRGIQTDRVVEVLSNYLKADQTANASTEEIHQRAVEGLALVGSDASIAPLLDAMRSDPSAEVRERAAAILAEAGMLTHDQRLRAVPQLINVSADSGLDPQVRTLAFQALGDITQQRLPNDSAAWREWFQNQSNN